MTRTGTEEARREEAKAMIRKAFEGAADVLSPEKSFSYALGQVSGVHCALCAMFQVRTPEREVAWEEFQAQRELYLDKHFPGTGDREQ